jgi:hypothetical protein
MLEGPLTATVTGCTVTLVEPVAVLERTLVAEIVTAPDGAVDGGVYRPEEEMVPLVEFPPVTPLTAQVTPWFEFPVTVAVYCDVCPTYTDDAPDTLTVS